MTPFLSGWFTILGLVYTTALYFMNMFNPLQSEKRVELHCAVGKLTLVTVLIHIMSNQINGFQSFAISSAVGLIFLTIGTGVILSYLPDAGSLRFHARSVHPALMVGVAVAAVHHILVQLSII